ncbi:MAG: YchJ family metal-binding protein [Porticoccus sp.]
MADTCICNRNKPFDTCCGRFLVAGQQAKTPEQLMRSRYSAYALGGYGDYLLSTWFSATALGLTAKALSEKTVEWIKLEVLSSNQTGDKATVEFKAFYREPDLSELQVMHEVSVFQRTSGHWLYVGGEVSIQP